MRVLYETNIHLESKHSLFLILWWKQDILISCFPCQISRRKICVRQKFKVINFASIYFFNLAYAYGTVMKMFLSWFNLNFIFTVNTFFIKLKISVYVWRCIIISSLALAFVLKLFFRTFQFNNCPFPLLSHDWTFRVSFILYRKYNNAYFLTIFFKTLL